MKGTLSRKIISNLTIIGLILFCLILPQADAREHSTKTEVKKIEWSGEKEVTVKMEIGAAKIDLQKSNSGAILDAEIEDDPDAIAIRAEYVKLSDHGKIYLKTDSREDNVDLGKDGNYWNLQFGDRVPLSFDIEAGACDADFDFTGVLVKDLDLELGASTTRVEFRRPNSQNISEISVDVGASKLKMLGLGNANFNDMVFDGGAGDFTLDFSGDFDHTTKVSIDIGIGSLRILVPEDAGIQIRKESSFLASFSIDEDEFEEVDDDLYENANFGKTKKELIFNIEAGLGSVRFEYSDGSL